MHYSRERKTGANLRLNSSVSLRCGFSSQTDYFFKMSPACVRVAVPPLADKRDT